MFLELGIYSGRSRTMTNFPDLNFEVKKYSHPFYVSSTNPIEKNSFVSNEIKIAYATARTLCSFHLDNKELYYDIISSLLSHLNFITKNTSDFLQLKKSRLDRLRDFSKTSRVGELAQGINYLFVQERLGYPFIVDFHFFYKEFYNVPFPGKKSPDFVLLDSSFRNCGLFESKGESSNQKGITGKSGKLQKSLNQLKAIVQPCATELIPCCTRFENNGTTNNSAIHYANIKKTSEKNEDLRLQLFRQHFASWFYLVGDFDRANALLQNNPIENLENDPNYSLGDDDNGVNNVYWLSRSSPIEIKSKYFGRIELWVHFWHANNFNVGIYKEVVEQLEGSNLNNESFSFSFESDLNYQKFTDGTIIKLNGV